MGADNSANELVENKREEADGVFTGWLIQEGLPYVLICMRPVCLWREKRWAGAGQSLLRGLQNLRSARSGERTGPGSPAEAEGGGQVMGCRLRVRGKVLGPGGQAGGGLRRPSVSSHRNGTTVSVLRCGRSSDYRAWASGKSRARTEGGHWQRDGAGRSRAEDAACLSGPLR